jgi:hypothetical protein
VMILSSPTFPVFIEQPIRFVVSLRTSRYFIYLV